MIKFVYFDLGGVAELDFSKTNNWEELIKELGIKSKQKEEYKEWFGKKEKEVCNGLDIETLVPYIRKHFNPNLPKSYSFLMGFVNRFEFNKSIWPVIEEVQRDCKIGLLTNAYPNMLNEIINHGLLKSTKWSVIIDSSVVGLSKPDQRIYKLAEKEAGVEGDEILFVENSLGHIEAAKKFGWNTFLYDPANPKKSSEDLLAFYRSLR